MIVISDSKDILFKRRIGLEERKGGDRQQTTQHSLLLLLSHANDSSLSAKHNDCDPRPSLPPSSASHSLFGMTLAAKE